MLTPLYVSRPMAGKEGSAQLPAGILQALPWVRNMVSTPHCPSRETINYSLWQPVWDSSWSIASG
jgi:hypothetical protein